MAKAQLKAGPAIPPWVAIVVIVAIVGVLIGSFVYTSVPRGPAPSRPGGPPAGMTMGGGPPGPGSAGRPGGAPAGMMGGPPGGMSGAGGRPGGPPPGMMGGPGGATGR